MTGPTEAIRGADSALQTLHRLWDTATAPVEIAAWELRGEPLPPQEALSVADFQPASVGDAWGRPWDTTWLRLTGLVPADWAGEPVEMVLDLGFNDAEVGFQAEGLIVDAAGRAIRGVHPRQQHYRITPAATGGEPVELLVEAAANPSDTTSAMTNLEPLYRIVRAELVLPRAVARDLFHDIDVLRTLLAVRGHAGGDTERTGAVTAALVEACALVSPQADDTDLVKAREILAPVLETPAAADAPMLSLVGHAHLDTAWLWPLRETVRKSVRTYANVLALMDEDPDLTFAGTQAVHHAWVRDLQPDLWSRLLQRVDEGRWVPVGGMWVESDTLLAAGESLARQLVHGQRFFSEHFGRTAKVGWLPDCFGYAPAFPQLLRQAGIESFLTQKLCWNDTNRFPHVTFWWEGLDGSRVLCHFPTVDTYNTELHSDDLWRITRGAPSGSPVPDSLAPMGYGDGGGGPTAQMLERARRMRDLDGLPRTRHVSPDDFFASLHATDHPTWRGDLYLETHRGVWTSQRDTKLGDARVSEALRDAELWCATAAVAGVAAYPHAALDDAWKRHLVLEFHDILPGSSITRVHQEAVAEAHEVLGNVLALRDSAIEALGGGTLAPASLPAATDGLILDNGLLRAVFDSFGHVSSLVDLRSGREMAVPDDPIGALHLHVDEPRHYDAWNIDRDYLERREVLDRADSVTVEESAIVVHRTFGESAVTLRWTMPADDARLDLRVDVDWYETRKLLKVTWPLDLRAPHVTAGVQLGVQHRALHENTSWEQARYEDWFHGFVHTAEGSFGAAVVTAGAHGYDATSRVRTDGGTTTALRISLVRAPMYPDPLCDRGHHTIDLSLLVGADLAAATTAAARARTSLIPGGAVTGLAPVAVVDGHGVQTMAVKLADDDSGDIVVRVAEVLGGRTVASIVTSVAVADAVRCDLLEEPVGDDEALAGQSLSVHLRPFEVATYRLRVAR